MADRRHIRRLDPGYTVKRSTISGGPCTTLVTDLVETTYTDTGLAAHTTYYYIVGNGEDGMDSDEVSATTVSGPLYRSECSPNMTPGSWENIGTAQAGPGGLLQFIVPISNASPAQFYRIKISR